MLKCTFKILGGLRHQVQNTLQFLLKDECQKYRLSLFDTELVHKKRQFLCCLNAVLGKFSSIQSLKQFNIHKVSPSS